MKRFFIISTIFIVLSLLVVNCQESTTPIDSTTLSATPVPYTTIPQPFSKNFYFLYGAPLAKGATPILRRLEEENIPLTDAWFIDERNIGPCENPIILQLIVRLSKTDDRIHDFGFVSDSSQVELDECIPTWLHYRF